MCNTQLDRSGRGYDGYLDLGCPWDSEGSELFNAGLRDELLDGEIFYSLAEDRIVLESWRLF